MKRILSIILVALLIATTVLLLVACGGIDNAEDFDKAKEAYATADAITLEINDNNKTMNNLVNKERLLSTVEIAFDAEMGVVAVSLDYSRRNLLEIETGSGKYERYYVLDGSNVIFHEKYVGKYSQEWNQPLVKEFDTDDAAAAFLRELYVAPFDFDEAAFPTFAELNLNGSYTINLFRNKYTFNSSDSRFSYTYTLDFANGQITKFTYQHKSASTGNIDDTRKFTMTIKYSAKVTLPDDLPNS